MFNKRKLWLAVLLLLSAWMLTACGGDGDDNGDNNSYNCSHNKVEVLETYEPTCTSAGEERVRCKSCNATIRRQTGKPALGHMGSTLIGTTPATCTEASVNRYSCSRCGEYRERGEEAALGHAPNEYNRCTRCGKQLPREVVREGNLVYTLHNGYYSLSFSGEPSGDIVIASTVDGLPVTSIPTNVFKGNTGITSIVMPYGNVESGMFEGCTGLVSVTLGEGVTSVGSGAFRGCTALRSVTMTENVTVIGAAAFSGCGSLTRLVLPFIGARAQVNLNYRNGWAFYETYYVLGYIFGQSNFNGAQKTTVCHDYDQWGNLIQSTFYVPASLSYLEILCGNVTTPGSNTRALVQGALDGCSMIKELVLPNKQIFIEQYALRGCTGITKLTMGDGFSASSFPNVTDLTLYGVSENTAFDAAQFAKITKLELHYSESTKTVATASLDGVRDKITGLYLTSPDTEVEVGALASFTKLKAAALPYTALTGFHLGAIERFEILSASPYTISQNLLAGATALRELTLAAGCQVIAANAFSNCTQLEKVTLNAASKGPKLENAVGSWLAISFGNKEANPLCHGAALYFKTSYKTYSAEEIALPETMTAIPANAFYGCNNLKSLTLPQTLATVGENAFLGCTALERVVYGGTLDAWCGISFANGEANPLHRATALVLGTETVTAIGSTLTAQQIPAYAFYGYKGLLKLELPATLTKIGEAAFSGCTALTEVTVPASVRIIEKQAFYGCTALGSATFANAAGWIRYESVDATEGYVLLEYHLGDPVRAAVCLASTYAEFVWKHIA